MAWSLGYWASARPRLDAPSQRIGAIDFARGVAVTLMILNHGVKGLLSFEQYPEWGLVPVHMITRFASSLFIMVFGIALAVVFLPKVGTDSWARRRTKLLLNGVVVYLWYKVLTVAEMLPYTPEQMLDALLHRSSPSFVEILGFYALALLWVPFFLQLWARMPLWLRVASPALLAAVSYFLSRHFDFWGSETIQALLVEHEDYYTWGQLSRGPLILLGLLLGEAILHCYYRLDRRRALSWALLAAGGSLLALFVLVGDEALYDKMLAIAFNEGKHPPELSFMLFSLGGAFAILGVALWGGDALARTLRPITLIGSDALQAFIFHIAVIFVVLRYLLGYWQNISYDYALFLTVCIIFSTALWIKLVGWVQARR